MEKIAILILHWNNLNETEICLKSVFNLDYKNFVVFLVDNGSTNDSLAQLKGLFKDVVYIETGKNLGFAGGMNAGFKEILKLDFDAVWFLNNDVKLQETSLSRLVERLYSGAGIGVAVPKVYEGLAGKTINGVGGAIDWSKGEARLIGNKEVDKGQYNQSMEVDFAPGSAVLVKREVLEKAGLICEDYFLYTEDVDWSMEVKKAGFVIVTEPSSVIWHNESASSCKNSPLKSYYYFRNLMIFMRKFTDEKGWQKFKKGFRVKFSKLMIKYLLKRRFDLIKASWDGISAYKAGITGKSEKYVPVVKKSQGQN